MSTYKLYLTIYKHDKMINNTLKGLAVVTALNEEDAKRKYSKSQIEQGNTEQDYTIDRCEFICND